MDCYWHLSPADSLLSPPPPSPFEGCKSCKWAKRDQKVSLEWGRCVLQPSQPLSFISSGPRCGVLPKWTKCYPGSPCAWHFEGPVKGRRDLQAGLGNFRVVAEISSNNIKTSFPTQKWEMLRIESLRSGKRAMYIASCEDYCINQLSFKFGSEPL